MDFYAVLLIVCVLGPIECALIWVIWRLRKSVMELTGDLDTLITDNRANSKAAQERMHELISAISDNKDGLVALKGDLDKILQGFEKGQEKMAGVLSQVATVLDELGLTASPGKPSSPVPLPTRKGPTPVSGEKT
jgi:hypothetical protein